MGLLKFLFYRKKKEEDLPIIAKVKFRKLEKEEIENYVNNLDSPILASRRYGAIMDENTEEEDLPIIAKVKFRKLEKEENENYVNNLDSSILASHRYGVIMDENTETDNKSKVKNTIHNESEREL